jgi:hypothetical protein
MRRVTTRDQEVGSTPPSIFVKGTAQNIRTAFCVAEIDSRRSQISWVGLNSEAASRTRPGNTEKNDGNGVCAIGTPFADRSASDGCTLMMKLGFRQGIASAAVFAAVVLMLISVDDRVRDRFGDLFSGSGSLSPWGDRVSDLGNAVMSAIRYQSIENAPLLVFAAAGAILFAFMLKS